MSGEGFYANGFKKYGTDAAIVDAEIIRRRRAWKEVEAIDDNEKENEDIADYST